jgi:hypothetical protein
VAAGRAAGSDPEVIGNYRLLRPLGEGGMGTVYEAEDIGSGRRVALKLISRELGASADAVERFRQEGRLASALVHPRCVFVYAADEEGGRPYIVMELMPGKTLEDLVREKGPLSIADAVEAIMDVIEGLQEAHQLGIIHRDVKPSNCFLDSDSRIKVGDFGLAKSLASGLRLTGSGSVLGTPLYASPEQVRADKLTPQTDVYSVTATLYFLLAGRAPFESGDAVATLARIVSEDPPPLRGLRPDVPELLDQVILRGLDRSREQRYGDLEALRQALRPFLPGSSPIVNLGVRFGAYVIDYLVLGSVGFVVGVGGVASQVASSEGIPVAPSLSRQAALHLVSTALFFLYFMPEPFLGWSLGKRILGLRVCGAGTTDPPGWRRGLLRTTVFYLLLYGGSWLTFLLVVVLEETPTVDLTGQAHLSLRTILLGMLAMIWGPVGVGLVCSTMRTRNGLRGLHDFATGTRVLSLAPKSRRKRLAARFRQPLDQRADLPDSVGTYRVKGALEWTAGSGVLIAEDPSLGREVLLWLRPATMPALDGARRGLSRTTRLRWLAAGSHGEQEWDAFLLPPGCTLPALIEAEGPLDWPEARHVLEELTRELARSCEDHALPLSLCSRQVWVQANGRVILLDPPLAPASSNLPASVQPAKVLPLEEQEQRMGLALVREVAALAAGGKGQPLPLHAVEMLRRLDDEKDGFQDLADFHAELRETRSLPIEVTRERRAAHLAVQAVLLFAALGCCMLPVGFLPELVMAAASEGRAQEMQARLDELERGARRDLLVSILHPHLWARLAGVARYGADMRNQEQMRERIGEEQARIKARIEAANPLMRLVMRGAQATLARDRKQAAGRMAASGPLVVRWRYRETTAALEWKRRGRTEEQWAMGLSSGALLIGPALWLLWSLVARGGLSFTIAGLALVRRDGRRVGRWQCAWRTLVVWGPVTALLVGSVVLESWYWMTWQVDDPRWWGGWLSRAAWWAGVGALVGWVVLVLRSPARALHDRLAGTFVVPL